MIHLPRPVLFALSALVVTAQMAVAGADDTVVPPKRGVVATATGTSGDSLVCSLLFVPALEAIFDDAADPITVVRGALDRYTNVDFPFLAFEHGDLRHPFVVGSLWNGEDAPASQQTKIPFPPVSGALGETVSLMVDHIDLLAKPDFQLVCEVETKDATGDAEVRRGQVLVKPGSITPHTTPSGEVSTSYALAHLAARETQIGVALAYFRDRRAADGLRDPGSCPPVDGEVAVVNAGTFKPLADRLVVEPIEAEESRQHEVTIFADDTTAEDNDLVPVLVAIRLHAAGAIDPDCQLVAATTATERSRGITSQLEIWEWRENIVR
jgi:hypothetical protein